MWADNETNIDLLGFKVHSDLIVNVVTDETVLPVVMGIFGDWGGGKSSVLRMVKEEFEDENLYKDVLCLYFNGWAFEGYEDAKSALLKSILIQIGENKRFGPAAKSFVVGLLKKVNIMEFAKLGVRHVGIPLAAGAVTGGAATLPMLLASLFSFGQQKQPNNEKKECSTNDNSIDWVKLIEEAPERQDILEVRKFREEFAELLKNSKIRNLLVIIDDLDRCLPERIIETLEAIKLFVAVPNTAFIIGADQRIVRHAISTRYVRQQLGKDATNTADEISLENDYLEKLIQIPYTLPRLSPTEIESYINLLHCQLYLTAEAFERLVEQIKSKRVEMLYKSYGEAEIIATIPGAKISDELVTALSWSKTVAPILTDGLKGNPRQIKRMLNAMVLRQRLANSAKLKILPDVLAKLMVLEYVNEDQFKKLNTLQSAENGFPTIIKKLELDSLNIINDEEIDDKIRKEWENPVLKRWLEMHPPLRDIDLRDYFWLARDKTRSITNTTIPPVVRQCFEALLSINTGEHTIAIKNIKQLESDEICILLKCLKEYFLRNPDNLRAEKAFMLLSEHNIKDAIQIFLDTLNLAHTPKLPANIPADLDILQQKYPDKSNVIKDLLQKFANDSQTKVGKASMQKIRRSQNGNI